MALYVIRPLGKGRHCECCNLYTLSTSQKALNSKNQVCQDLVADVYYGSQALITTGNSGAPLLDCQPYPSSKGPAYHLLAQRETTHGSGFGVLGFRAWVLGSVCSTTMYPPYVNCNCSDFYTLDRACSRLLLCTRITLTVLIKVFTSSPYTNSTYQGCLKIRLPLVVCIRGFHTSIYPPCT